MQTCSEIREILAGAGLSPNKRLGQCFMIDKNLLGKVLALADPGGDRTVLEVGPGTGTLTEELLTRAGRVAAVELDHGLADVIRMRFADRENFVLVEGDVLAGKHALSPAVKAELGLSADLVANLPYSIATPLIAQCLIESWRAVCGLREDSVRFDSMTFTVQREVAGRMLADPGGGHYGPISVLVALLGKGTAGPAIPASAFWPAPKIASRALRIDFDPQAAGMVDDVAVLSAIVAMAFGQRRKQVGSIFRRSGGSFDPDLLRSALETAGVDPSSRAERITPEQFRLLANAVCAEQGG
ncbi:MAG: 16S rRNA (adenine(1518)-N(6)/adenine(1519)-N(6))-dimethyltransferase RsmA [Phycisphaerae bacterium]|jgi:16S rRNA (adenine1518-N6/adenine1519-N6)-dimethyltransferase|nr:16S rRNA (adenine(1518)-N(6)/adenine(1519)-N(6))-dimethyltransferase RsmA [Phycisphaerae bacterium]